MTDAQQVGEELEDEVLNTLPTLNADELVEVCTVVDLQVEEQMKGKRNLLIKHLLKFLCDVDVSKVEGLEIVRKVQKHLNKEQNLEEVKPKVPPVEELKHETKIDVMKLKDLKISGTIGNMGEKDKLSFSSLWYQVENAKKMKYPEHVICAAVIKAISPGNHLRTYLESTPNMTLDGMLDFLRSHFRERDSASVFTDLQNAAQWGTETAMEFIVRLMCLRQKVLTLSTQEGCAYDKNMLSKHFFKKMFIGLRNENIRAEIRDKCKDDFTISDDKLLKLASDAVANEMERKEKLAAVKKPAVNAIEKFENENSGKAQFENIESLGNKKKENPFVKIEELRISQEKAMEMMRAELSEIKNVIKTSSSLNNTGWPPQQQQRRRFRKCQQCETDRVPRCIHCFKCGSADHRIAECPTQKN